MKVPKPLSIAILSLCLFISLVCVAYPIYVIRPFRAQGASELIAALAVLQVRIPITLIAAFLSAGCLAVYWRQQSRRLFRTLAVSAFLLTTALAFLAHVNVYEIMFHPNEHPSFTAASDTKLDKEEKVLAVKVGNVARAYPIRGLAYHHIANDVIDKLAIVATY